MGRGVTIGLLQRTGATFTELVSEMGAQVLCGTRRDTKKKIAANSALQRGKVPRPVVGGNSCLWDYPVGNGTSGGLFKK